MQPVPRIFFFNHNRHRWFARTRDQDRARRLSQHAVYVGTEERAHAETSAVRTHANQINLFFFGIKQNFTVRLARAHVVFDATPPLHVVSHGAVQEARCTFDFGVKAGRREYVQGVQLSLKLLRQRSRKVKRDFGIARKIVRQQNAFEADGVAGQPHPFAFARMRDEYGTRRGAADGFGSRTQQPNRVQGRSVRTATRTHHDQVGALFGGGTRDFGRGFALLNPINHSSTRAGLHKYCVEPYVAAADVYAVPPHTGRGGWTWYTGSAAWMYRAGLESILGFQLRGDRLRIDPCIPRSWREFEITYTHDTTRYVIKVENPHGVCRGVSSVELDGEMQPSLEIVLASDGAQHNVRVVLGEP